MRLLDANILLHAVNRSSEDHGAARRCLEDSLSGTEIVGIPWVCLLAFIRLSTRAGIFDAPLSVPESLAFVEAWLTRPPVMAIEPTVRHLGILRGLLAEVGTGGNLTTDAHLAAMAIEHGAELWSFDSDFARFSGVQWQRPR